MSNRPQFLFAVYEGDKRVYDGASADVAAWLGMADPNRLYTYVYNGNKWKRRYRIVKTFEEVRPRVTDIYVKPRKNARKMPKEKNHIIPESEEEEYLHELIRRFSHYNETFSWNNGEQFKERLNDAGIFFTSRRCMDGKGYILERI